MEDDDLVATSILLLICLVVIATIAIGCRLLSSYRPPVASTCEQPASYYGTSEVGKFFCVRLISIERSEVD